MEKLLNVKDLSQLLCVKQSTIYDWVHQGIIPYYKVNKLVRFRESEINEWLKKKQRRKHKQYLSLE